MSLKLENSKPKFGLNISKKEKGLLLLLVSVLLLWLFYRFVMTPQEAAITLLRGEKEKAEQEMAATQEMLSRGKMISNELESVKGEYARAIQKYYYGVDQPELIHILNSVADSSKLEIPSMNFTMPVDTSLKDVDAKLTGVAIAYRGGFIDLENMLSVLRHSPKRLLMEQLSFYRKEKDVLDGQLTLKAIGYKGIEERKDGYFDNNGYVAQTKDNPFAAYKGYDEVIEDSGEKDEKRLLLADMESDSVYFMTADSGVTGNVERIKGGKYGKTAIRAEYFISTGYQPERAYVVLDDQNINIKYPPQSVGVWAYSYGYSPVTVGMRYQTPEGEKIDVEIEKGISWIGWKFISAAPPQDVKLYPLKLDRLYIQLEPNKDDYGVLLFDRLEVVYPKNEEQQAAAQSFEFYVVQPGETLMGISKKFYGSSGQYTKIMKDNSLTSPEKLEAGQVLVIRK